MNGHNKVPYFKVFVSNLNMSGIEYLVKITDVSTFEKINPPISVYVFGYENDEVYPLRTTSERFRTYHINFVI